MKYLPTLLILVLTGVTSAASSDFAKQLYDRVTPSLVAVQYTWESEAGRHEVVGGGVAVSEDGLIMFSIALVDTRIPDEQMKDFKIIIPRNDADDEEIDAVFVGRDERSDVAFVRPGKAKKFPAIKFDDLPTAVGDEVYSIGILPKMAGYRSYITSGLISAKLRGEAPMTLVESGLTTPGSVVFNAAGHAIGLVNVAQGEPSAFLNGDPRNALMILANPPRLFVPAKEFLFSLSDLPKPGEQMKLPWTGISQLAGVKKEVAEFYNIKQPAVQIGDVIASAPAAKAGMKRGDIIVAINGQPLERGDDPEELPLIFRHRLLQLKPGSKVIFAIRRAADQPATDITVTLAEQPAKANLASRFFGEDLGLAVRDVVFSDTYTRKLSRETKGVIVAFVRPSSSAATAKLQREDFVTEFNHQPVEDVPHFKQAYQTFRKAHPTEAAVLMVMREGNTQVIRIEPPQ